MTRKKPAKKQAKKRAAKPKPPAEPEANQPAAPKLRLRQTRMIDRREAFLKAYSITASIDEAAEAAKISRFTHYAWMEDPEYSRRFQQVKIQTAQSIEDEIARRAMRGVYEPNVFQGKFVYPQEEVVTPAVLGPRGGVIEPERREWRDKPGALPFGIWRKSDTLLIHLARAFMPERYGMRGQFELSGPHGGPMEIVERLHAARARAAAKRDDDRGTNQQ